MPHHLDYRSGFTLVQLVVVLVLLGILAGLAVPQVRTQIERLYVRAALNRVVGEVYRARMLAVESGMPVQMIFHSDASRCVSQISVSIGGDLDRRIRTEAQTLPGLCLRHSGDSTVVFNSRGMLRPPTRSFHITYGSAADSVLLSIAGRVRRSF